MGVPKFYRWLSERYPNINQVISSDLKPEFDCLYLDMNGIVHNCTHPDDDVYLNLTEEDMFAGIFKYIDRLFSIAQPKKLLFMAIDGVAPRAKMNQQRQRRFRSAKETKESLLRMVQEGEVPPSTPFDSNCITPGTEFMAKLSRHLQFYVKMKLHSDPSWQKIEVILSGAEVPGEGEHKIMMYIRQMKMQPGYNPNLRHCLYGLDADLVMLALASHEPHFALLREEVVFGNPSRDTPRKQLLKLNEFQFLHISVLRECLDLEFKPMADTLPFKYDLERVIDDWVVLAFLVGNDFLPHLPTLDIGEGALDDLYSMYRKRLPELGGYVCQNGRLHPARLEVLLAALGQKEEEIFSQREQDEKEFLRRQRRFHMRDGLETEAIKIEKQLAALQQQSEQEQLPFKQRYYRQRFKDWYTGDKDSKVSPDEPALPDYIACAACTFHNTPTAVVCSVCNTDLPSTGGAGGGQGDEGGGSEKRGDWSQVKLKRSKAQQAAAAPVPHAPAVASNVRELVKSYLEGLCWVASYYYQGVCSWKWFYPFYYSPLASDMVGLADIAIGFELGEPFKPLEQLLSVLPASSGRRFLPQAFQSLLGDSSPILDYYPEDFQIDMNGKKNSWEGIGLIPFIDEVRLKVAIARMVDEKRLTRAETARNARVGTEWLCSYDAGAAPVDVASPLPKHFSSLKRARLSFKPWLLPPIPLDSHKSLLHPAPQEPGTAHFALAAAGVGSKTGEFVPALCPGLVAPAPGYPWLSAHKVNAKLAQVNVNCFGRESKKESLLLSLLLPPELLKFLENTQVLAARFVGSRVYVDYPFLKEALVAAASDGVRRYEPNAQVKYLTPSEQVSWQDEARQLQRQYLSRRAIDTGSVALLLHVRVFEGMRTMRNGAVKKWFSTTQTSLPVQMAVLRVSRPDPRFQEHGAPKLRDAFPVGAEVAALEPRFYGCVGTVEAVEDKEQSVTVTLKVPPREPGLTHQLVQSLRLNWYPAHDVAKKLQLHPSVLGRVLSSLILQPGRTEVGLKLRFTAEGLAVPEFARRRAQPATNSNPNHHPYANINQHWSTGGWEYSELCVALVAAYKRRFPYLFDYMQEHRDENSVSCAHLLNFRRSRAPAGEETEEERKQDAKAVATEIKRWVKKLPISKLLLTSADDTTIASSRAAEAISLLYQHFADYAEPLQWEQVVLTHVRAHSLYRTTPTVPWSPTEKEKVDLGDRVMSLRADEGVPFGVRGTVMALYGKTIEVIWDTRVLGGSSLLGRCPQGRGKLMLATSLLNLSKPRKVVPPAHRQLPNESHVFKTKPAGPAPPFQMPALPVESAVAKFKHLFEAPAKPPAKLKRAQAEAALKKFLAVPTASSSSSSSSSSGDEVEGAQKLTLLRSPVSSPSSGDSPDASPLVLDEEEGLEEGKGKSSGPASPSSSVQITELAAQALTGYGADEDPLTKQGPARFAKGPPDPDPEGRAPPFGAGRTWLRGGKKQSGRGRRPGSSGHGRRAAGEAAAVAGSGGEGEGAAGADHGAAMLDFWTSLQNKAQKQAPASGDVGGSGGYPYDPYTNGPAVPSATVAVALDPHAQTAELSAALKEALRITGGGASSAAAHTPKTDNASTQEVKALLGVGKHSHGGLQRSQTHSSSSEALKAMLKVGSGGGGGAADSSSLPGPMPPLSAEQRSMSSPAQLGGHGHHHNGQRAHGRAQHGANGYPHMSAQHAQQLMQLGQPHLLGGQQYYDPYNVSAGAAPTTPNYSAYAVRYDMYNAGVHAAPGAGVGGYYLMAQPFPQQQQSGYQYQGQHNRGGHYQRGRGGRGRGRGRGRGGHQQPHWQQQHHNPGYP